MDSIIENIVKIASELDDKGSEKLADALDSFARSLMDIKVAQYVGSQGYWIRNSRCWANCYRQKRAQNPNMPAQEVWTSCHEEYVDSITKTNSGESTAAWDKYASSKDKTDYAELFNEDFANSIQRHVDDGMDRGHAIFAAIDEMNMRPYDQLVEASEKAFNLASQMFEISPREATKLAQQGEQLVKEAQWWKRRMNDMAGPARDMRQMWNPAVMDGKSQGEFFNAVNLLDQAVQNIRNQRDNVVSLANNAGLGQYATQVANSIPDTTIEQLSQGVEQIAALRKQIDQRETGGERGNMLQRGLGWMADQAQQGANKARSSEQFMAEQSGQSPSNPAGSTTLPDGSTMTGSGVPQNANLQVQNQPADQGDQSYNVPAGSDPNNPFSSQQPAIQEQARQDAAQQQQQQQQRSGRGYEDNLVNSIRSVVRDETALRDLFQPIFTQRGIYVDPNSMMPYNQKGAEVDRILSNIIKIASNPQNNGGEILRQIEQELQAIKDPEILKGIYMRLLREMRGQQTSDQYSGDAASPSFGGKNASSKKPAKAAGGKAFNLKRSR
jgi:hypothetical protein